MLSTCGLRALEVLSESLAVYSGIHSEVRIAILGPNYETEQFEIVHSQLLLHLPMSYNSTSGLLVNLPPALEDEHASVVALYSLPNPGLAIKPNSLAVP